MSGTWIYAELVANNINKLQLTKQELAKLQRATEQEEGCIQFAVCQVNGEGNIFTLWEHWVDEDAFRKHMQASHTKNYFALKLTRVRSSHRLKPLLDKSLICEV